jgi:glycerol-3-phosphate O-acyltransferase
MAHKTKNAERGSETFTAPAAYATDYSSDWLRLPKPKQRLWGMSRTTWNELLDGGKVKGITLRKKHAQRGIKLIFRPSAESYLKSLLDSKESQQ